MISIIIPLWNQSKKLDKCLESISRQTYENFEIIVVNDRSTDSLSKVMEKYKKIFGYKIEFYHNQKNHGAPYSRNKGFRLSKGEYVIFCDADLILKPYTLETMLDTLRNNPQASYVYTSFMYGFKKFKLWEFDENKLKEMPYIQSFTLIRREHFPKKGWDETLKKFQDWDLWLTMLDEGHKGKWINKYLFKVQSGGTMSSWLPSFFYKYFPFLKNVKKYKKAMEIIKNKHNLNQD